MFLALSISALTGLNLTRLRIADRNVLPNMKTGLQCMTYRLMTLDLDYTVLWSINDYCPTSDKESDLCLVSL